MKLVKKEWDRVSYLLIFKNHYILIKKLHVCLGNQNLYLCLWRCWSSYSYQNVLLKHIQRYDQQKKCRTSIESHLYWREHFQNNFLNGRIFADFEDGNEVFNSSRGNRRTNLFKQRPVCNGYYIISESVDVLRSGYHESPLGHNNVDWFGLSLEK